MWFLKPGVSFCINLEPFYKILAICKWNFLEIPIQSVQKSLNLLFQCTMFLMFPLFKKYPSLNQQSGKQCCLPHLSFKISLKDTSFNISLNSLLRVLPLSPMLVAFSLTCFFHHVLEKTFGFWCSHSLKMHWIYAFLLMSQSPTQNSR